MFEADEESESALEILGQLAEQDVVVDEEPEPEGVQIEEQETEGEGQLTEEAAYSLQAMTEAAYQVHSDGDGISDWSEIIGELPDEGHDEGHDEGQAASHWTEHIPEVCAPVPMGDAEILGALVSEGQAFNDYEAVVEQQDHPIVADSPLMEWRDWQIDFGPASAPAGEILKLTASPQCLFRGEKVVATDTATPPGTGTRISTITVGQRVQRPAGGSGLTLFFSQNTLGNGIKWDTSDRALTISVTVSFIIACTFDMSVFGRCVL